MTQQAALRLFPQTDDAPDQLTQHEFDELVLAHRAVLIRYVYQRTWGDLALAEDIVQETFLRAWQHLTNSSNPITAVRPWLFVIARRLVIDHQRRRDARPGEVLGVGVDDAPAERDEFSQVLVRHDLQHAIAQLSDAHREALLQVYYEDRPVEEVAARLGIPIGTVRSRAHYAARTVRALLEGHQPVVARLAARHSKCRRSTAESARDETALLAA